MSIPGLILLGRTDHTIDFERRAEWYGEISRLAHKFWTSEDRLKYAIAMEQYRAAMGWPSNYR